MLAALRRYHLLYRSLPEDQKRLLDQETDPARKVERVVALKANQPTTASRARSDVLQISALSPARLRGTARDLIIYFHLDPVKDARERAELARAKTPAERAAITRRIIQERDLISRQDLRQKLREEDSEFREVEARVVQKNALLQRLKKAELEATKADPTPKKAGNGRFKDAQVDLKGVAQKRRNDLIHLLDEQQIIREMRDQTVAPGDLERFEQALPAWATESLDNLPPDAARDRLTTLYRLVFPSPEEMPIQKAPEKPKAAPRRVSPQGGGITPF